MQITQLAAWNYIDCFMMLKGAVNKDAAYKFINIALATENQKLSTTHSLAFPVNGAAIPAASPDLQYESAEQALKPAPMIPGVTVETDGPDVSFQDWVQAWIEFKVT